MGPNGSEWVRTRPKASKNLAKTSKTFAKLSAICFSQRIMARTCPLFKYGKVAMKKALDSDDAE